MTANIDHRYTSESALVDLGIPVSQLIAVCLSRQICRPTVSATMIFGCLQGFLRELPVELTKAHLKALLLSPVSPYFLTTLQTSPGPTAASS